MNEIYLLCWDDGGASGIGGFKSAHATRRSAGKARQERIKTDYKRGNGSRRTLEEHYYILSVPFIE